MYIDSMSEPELTGWAKLKDVMFNYILRYENHPEKFQTLSITRADGSNTTYNRFSDLLKDYRHVCDMADKEALGSSPWGPIAIRLTRFNRWG